MGDLQAWFAPDHSPPPAAPFGAHPPNPLPSEVGAEGWRQAERATRRVIESVQATALSERKRLEVVDYVQRLIRHHLGCEVFPFGSVPLKTYLPDGDIDLTAIALPIAEDVLAANVRHVLEMEGQNNDAEYEIKDVQYIHAEVKLVKCLIQNIVVDISFNQSGGLSTLCFLEQVDRLIGKDHLFKRSIILIKTWCYYESRILGAHHGLISTYALETLVLHIFQFYHSSLEGPLAVLYRFLDYYSKFDWEHYCVSLCGPVSVSSLPEIVVVQAPETNEGDWLFTKEFLRNSTDNFSVSRGQDSTSRNFLAKHLNIVDPLKENNNLGRSVNRGNFYRIRSAFSYGARKLGRILLLPPESIGDEMNMFFSDTLDRHGNGERPDVQGPTSYLENISVNQNGANLSSPQLQAADANGELSEGFNSIRISGLENENGVNPSDEDARNFSPPDSSETDSSASNASLFTHASLSSSHSEDGSSTGDEKYGARGRSNLENLAELTGDYDLHVRNLIFVQWCQEHPAGNIVPFYAQSSYQYHNKNFWDHSRRRGALSRMHTNGMTAAPFSPSGSYPVTSPFIAGAYGIDDLPKTRGTGTYFPNVNYAYRERHSPGRVKSPVNANHFTRHRNNGRGEAHHDFNLEERGNSDPVVQLQLPVFGANGHGKTTQLDSSSSPRPPMKDNSSANPPVFPREGELEFGSFGPIPLAALTTEPGRRSGIISPRAEGSASPTPASSLRRPYLSLNHERSARGYQLKDDEDFPPLAS